MGFVKVELKPQPPILLWFVWKSNQNNPLEGYFLGLIERKQNEDRTAKAMVVYDDETNKAWIAFLRGKLWNAPWSELLYKRIRVTYWHKPEKKGFELEYDPEDTLPEADIPEIEFSDKFEGFRFINLKEEEEEVPF